MKGKELIKLIQDNGLEDFRFEFTLVDGFDGGFPNRRRFSISELSDIGHSDKVVCLDGKEK